MRSLSSRQRFLVAYGLAVSIVAGVAFAVWPKELVYEEKPLSYWLDQLPPTMRAPYSIGLRRFTKFSYGSIEFLADENAFDAVDALGPRCLPVLLKRLQADRNDTLTRWTRSLQRRAVSLHFLHPRFNYTWLGSGMTRGQAVTALVRLGDTAKPVLPQVLALAKSDPDAGVRASALEVLRHLSLTDYAQLTGLTNAFTAVVQ